MMKTKVLWSGITAKGFSNGLVVHGELLLTRTVAG